MDIYFGFSDENGSYNKNMSKKFKRAHPYYIRTTVIVPAQKWKKITSYSLKCKDKYNLPIEKEIKWNFLWSLVKNKGQKIDINKPYYFLRDIPFKQIFNYFDELLVILSAMEGIRVICSITDNNNCVKNEENNLLKFHIQNHMQRFQMELQPSDGFGVFFIDPISVCNKHSEKKDDYLREIYNQIYRSGDFISKYTCIKDSLNIEYSHHSTGIQLADIISGVVSSFLRGNSESTKVFYKRIYPHLRRGGHDQILGYGLMEVPANSKSRKILKEKLNTILYKTLTNEEILNPQLIDSTLIIE